ncbi:hypothetical protein AYL99_11010 [Fonsecaea erecta]|uniref:Uncharacterized protein n=1 Tax=Fonsecaea erecta TaxID=1367422 RepID=A0A178Z4A5_9EURO|nr:hypothetical protein AYL99_11010 [Fonsecaea erecta]OAP54562.1 hypothetical protein AYL99_11010 [Fonsecaea erecta]
MRFWWHVTEKEAIAKFQADVAAHTNALNTLLATASVKMAQNNNSKLEQLASATQESVQRRDGQLLRISDKLEHSSSLLVDGKSLLESLGAASPAFNRAAWM